MTSNNWLDVGDDLHYDADIGILKGIITIVVCGQRWITLSGLKKTKNDVPIRCQKVTICPFM